MAGVSIFNIFISRRVIMKANDLYKLAQWYEHNIVGNNLTQLYNDSVTKINSLLTSKSQYVDQKIAVYDQISGSLCSQLENIDYGKLNFDDTAVLDKLGLKHVVLEPACESIKELVSVEEDIHTISARFTDKLRKIKRADAKFKQLLTLIPSMFEISEIEQYNSEKVLTRIKFHNEASINNVVNLNDWSSSLNKIARGYSMVLNQAPEDFEVVSASKGSIIFDLLLNLETINMLGETFNYIADFALTCTELKLALQGIEYFKDKNPEQYKILKEQAEQDAVDEQDSMAEVIAEKLHQKYAVDKTNHEAKQNLKSAVREVNKFIDKGGDINFKSTDGNIEKSEQVRLVNEALKMLQARSEPKQIEDHRK